MALTCRWTLTKTMAFLLDASNDIEDAIIGETEAEQNVEDEGKTLPRLVDSGANDPIVRAAGSQTGRVLLES